MFEVFFQFIKPFVFFQRQQVIKLVTAAQCTAYAVKQLKAYGRRREGPQSFYTWFDDTMISALAECFYQSREGLRIDIVREVPEK